MGCWAGGAAARLRVHDRSCADACGAAEEEEGPKGNTSSLSALTARSCASRASRLGITPAGWLGPCGSAAELPSAIQDGSGGI